MLSVVGHPNCINPDEKLERLAKAYDWPILDIFSSGRRDGDAPYSRKDRSE
jgi:phosphoserine phosphatase